MTQSNPLPVIQEDRDAAAAFVRVAWHLFWPGDYERAMQDARDMEAGSCDNWLLVQSFARHRLSSQSAEVARLRQALEPFAKACTITTRGDDEHIDDTIAATKITFGDLRRALAALNQTKEQS
jgi:hypothetical protein